MEKLRNAFLKKLQESGRSIEDINGILSAFDVASTGFKVVEEETGLIVQGSFPELAKVYLAAKHVEGLAYGTLENYRYRLQHFFDNTNVPIEKITANHIRTFLFAYQESRKISTATLDEVRTTLNSFFGWLATEGYIDKNPVKAIRPIKHEKKQRRSLDRMTLEKLRRSCKSLRDIALLDALYSTGCRVSELTNIKISDVDFITGEIVVMGKGRKQRSVYLNASASLSINAYLSSRKDDSPYLFVSSRAPHHNLARTSVERAIKKIAKDANVGTVTPHVIRHTTATLALRSGMPVQDIQKMLGHSNISTTMIYAETDRSLVKAGHSRCVV